MPVVPTQRIDFGSPRNFSLAIRGALMRAGLSDASARLLTAHTALSTGWGRAVDNYRLAGIKASASWRVSRPYVEARGCECKAGYPNNGDPKCGCGPGKGQVYKSMYWRAYNSLDDAAIDLLRSLRSSRYRKAYAMLQAGDPEYGCTLTACASATSRCAGGSL